MQFSPLVILTLATLVQGNSTPSAPPCQTLTTTVDPPGSFSSCTVLACIEIKPITQKCGCSTIPTTSVTRTACPTSCGSTSYITAIEDCFPTQQSPSSTTTSPSATTTLPSSTTTKITEPPVTSSTTTPHEPPPTTTPPHQNPYTNTTKIITKTEHTTTTLTTCPAEHVCTGQTITVTSTEFCPTATCVCVLPSVTFTTTLLPGPTQSQQTSAPAPVQTTQPGNTPPSPTPRPSASIIEANIAERFGIEAGLVMTGALAFALVIFL